MFTQDTQQDKITVLGKTFNSEDERREYFRNELRSILPELKQMEGFPIGEDEDIIKLSDPPYYTACPNPWLNDFIAEWEDGKKQLLLEGKRVSDFEVDEPYASDVSVGKSNPVYTAHTYHTKVPHPAIMRYILHYTNPGDIILDGFGGTGMTGVACGGCETSDNKIKLDISNEWKAKYNREPNWGKRHAICQDLSPIATYITSVYNSKVDFDELIKESNSVIEEIKSRCKWMYETKHDNGQLGRIAYVVWSNSIICQNCSTDFVYWSSALNREEKTINDFVKCPKCGVEGKRSDFDTLLKSDFDVVLGDTIKSKHLTPVLIKYKYGNKGFEKEPDEFDLKNLEKINNTKIGDWVPSYRMPSGDEARRNDKEGVTNVHHFYTKRNLLALSIANQVIEESNCSHILKFILTGMVVRSTLMNRMHVRNYFFGGGGWNAGHLKGTLYIPPLPMETSILEQLDDKFKGLIKALRFMNRQSTSTITSTGSTTKLPVGDESIDYIFTDPPFGANIMYSELNFLWESWLKVITNNSDEAICNKTQNKNLLQYQNLITHCFKEYFRVLKKGKWITIEFSNTSAAVWNSIQTALLNSGFVIANTSALDKKQGGMRSITTATAVRQDLIITCYKPSSEFDEKFKQHQNTDVAVWDFVEEHLHHLPIHLVKENATTAIIERSPKILFDRLIAFYVQKGLPVPIDAGKFQEGLRERFIERDGMFFSNEQVQEYDKKKAEAPSFIQLSILVSSEQDGVYWLKNLLKEKSLTYQDIQPQWMQALAGVRKGDVIPELATILDENFLKDNEGKWYLPDPENEADLEKLRNKRLLKQFEDYKSQATTARAKKIKEVRVDALRAGFKQCYQDKDFPTIVAVGDKIPNNLLMEDEVLLQFYDIASSRV